MYWGCRPPWCAATVCSRSCSCSAAPIRHTAQRPAGAPQTLELVSCTHELQGLPTDLPIQELMGRLAEDQHRTDRIVAAALSCWGDGRKLLLLSERTDHITAIAGALAEQVLNLYSAAWPPERAPAQRHPGRAGAAAS